ncbi:hypothetical protein BDF14DRAFT_1756293 [Spinellus fusiger]|nr:hypothetical protein BDF14DRAFT_1756293 [Spinellus fusiger]
MPISQCVDKPISIYIHIYTYTVLLLLLLLLLLFLVMFVLRCILLIIHPSLFISLSIHYFIKVLEDRLP